MIFAIDRLLFGNLLLAACFCNTIGSKFRFVFDVDRLVSVITSFLNLFIFSFCVFFFCPLLFFANWFCLLIFALCHFGLLSSSTLLEPFFELHFFAWRLNFPGYTISHICTVKRQLGVVTQSCHISTAASRLLMTYSVQRNGGKQSWYDVILYQITPS